MCCVGRDGLAKFKTGHGVGELATKPAVLFVWWNVSASSERTGEIREDLITMGCIAKLVFAPS